MTTPAMPEPPETGKRQLAPGELSIVQEFINAWALLQGVDRLSKPVSLEEWLAEHRLVKGKLRATEADLRHALEVREALRELLEVNDGGHVGKDAVETLSRAARSAQLVVQFDERGEAKLEPAASGIDAALGKILAIVFRAMTDGSWKRLKACRDHTCRWAFYDRSKNHSSHWCSMSVCGNRSKARTYREHKYSEHVHAKMRG